MSRYSKIIYSLVFIFIVSPAIYIFSEKMKRRPGFCVSCHIDSATPLHADKHRQFMEPRPVNMSGLHRMKSKDFKCPDCHMGRTLKLKAKIFFLETYNTISHILVKSEEPEKLDLKLMPDENCTFCHKKFALSKTTFHGISPHNSPFPMQCVVCHSSHLKGRSDYFFLNDRKLREACKNCHPRFSSAFSKLLKE